MQNTLFRKRDLYLTLIVLSLTCWALYHKVFAIPPDSEILFYVGYPLITGNFNSFIHWLIFDTVELTRLFRQIPLFVQGVVMSLSNDYAFNLHLLSFVFFIITGLLIFLLLRREKVKFGLASLGGILFLIHPTNAINVTKLIHFMGLWGFTFFLLALNLYVYYRDRPKSLWIYALEALSIIFILFSYEMFAVAPLLLVIYEFFIKAHGKLKNINASRLLSSFALWGFLTAAYMALRFAVFQGIGGYESFGQANPISPFLKGGKWLTGLGFLHFSDQTVGWLDIISVLALTLIFIMIFLRKENRYLLIFVPFWFVGASLPFYFVTATYHYVFAFPWIGIIVALILGVNELTLLPFKFFWRTVLISTSVLIMLIWTYETHLGIADVERVIRRDIARTQVVYDRISDKDNSVLIFLAAEKEEPRLLLRLIFWHYPAKVEIKNIMLTGKNINVDKLFREDQTHSASKIYAWRRGDVFTFYPSLDVLLEEVRHYKKPFKTDFTR